MNDSAAMWIAIWCAASAIGVSRPASAVAAAKTPDFERDLRRGRYAEREQPAHPRQLDLERRLEQPRPPAALP